MKASAKPLILALMLMICGHFSVAFAAEPPLFGPPKVASALNEAIRKFHEVANLRGGYVYYYSAEFKQRWGEGPASPTQIWVQPPGTPTVGEAFLTAYHATGDSQYLELATTTADALLFGQLQSGGWQNHIDFDPSSKEAGQYRNGKGNPKGRNYSTLDDNATQAVLTFLMHCDQAHKFENQAIHTGVKDALQALLQAQFPNGAFPQVFSGPVTPRPVVAANYPTYDWRTENRVKEYWNLYTLNDGLAGDVARVLIEADAIYGLADPAVRDDRFRTALLKLGDFLLLAQMPEPQPAWAQQYLYTMQPAWARKFEPPAIASRESEDAIATLLTIYEASGDAKYLAPIPKALAYLKKCELESGQFARYYELQTNRPLYMTSDYQLTHSDADLPTRYGFKVSGHVDRLQARYEKLVSRKWTPGIAKTLTKVPSDQQVAEIMDALDGDKLWMSEYQGEALVGQPKFAKGQKYLASAVFCKNVGLLSAWLLGQRGETIPSDPTKK